MEIDHFGIGLTKNEKDQCGEILSAKYDLISSSNDDCLFFLNMRLIHVGFEELKFILRIFLREFWVWFRIF